MFSATHARGRVDDFRVAALAIIGSALVITAACGGQKEENNTQSTSNVSTPATTATPVAQTDTVNGKTIGDTVGAGEPVAPVNDDAVMAATIAYKKRDVHGLTQAGRQLLESGNAKEALRTATRAVALDQKSHDAYRLMARAHATLNMPNEALEEYRIALSLDPEDAWSMNNMGLLLVQQGHYEEALPPLARATQLSPRTAVFQNNLGVALEHTGHFVLAASAYRSALDSDSSYLKARVSLARVNGRKEESTTTSVDLATLAASFDHEVRTTFVSARPTNRDTLPR